MKRLFFLLFALPLWAMYTGNPAFPELPEEGLWMDVKSQFGWKIDYIGSALYDRRMELDSIRIPQPEPIGSLSSLGYRTERGGVTCNWNNKVEGFFCLGAMRLTATQNFPSLGSIDYKTDWSLLFSVGGRIALIYWKEALLGVSASYMRSRPSVSTLSQNSTSLPEAATSIPYSEWQVGVSASRQFGWVTPYLGVAFGKAFVTLNKAMYQNTTPAFAIVGFSVTSGRGLIATLEGGLLGEYAISWALSFRF